MYGVHILDFIHLPGYAWCRAGTARVWQWSGWSVDELDVDSLGEFWESITWNEKAPLSDSTNVVQSAETLIDLMIRACNVCMPRAGPPV